jgi:hypothetical protein
MKCSFENGKVHGDFIQNYDDGQYRLKGAFKNGYIIGLWEYNLRLKPMICDYLKEEYSTMTGFDRMTLSSIDDCEASFSYLFRHKTEGACANSMCIDLEFVGKYR